MKYQLPRAASLFLVLTGFSLFAVGSVIYSVPSSLSLVGLYLFVIGLLLLSIGILGNLPAILIARWQVAVDFGEAALYMILVTTCLLCVNRIVVDHVWRRDVTQDRVHTLAPQTKAVLAKLVSPVQLVGFLRRGDSRADAVRGLLKEYQEASRLIRSIVLDPDEHPSDANRYGVTGKSSIVIACGNRTAHVQSMSEGHLTAALLRLVSPPVAVGFVVGHKERDLTGTERDQLSGLVEILELENFEPVRVSLAAEDPPERVRALVIPGPRKDFTPEEIRRLAAWVGRGKGLMICLELAADPQPNLNGFLAELGVESPPGLVLDENLHVKNDAGTLVIQEFPNHAITRGIHNLVLSGCRPLMPSVNRKEPVPYEPLAASSKNSWAEMDAGRDFHYTPGRDVPGPVPLAICSEKNHVLLVGNTLFMTDVFLGSAENREFAVNAIAWVASVADLPAIIPEPRVHRLLSLSKDSLQVITSLVCLGMPATTAMLGVFLYLYRRG